MSFETGNRDASHVDLMPEGLRALVERAGPGRPPPPVERWDPPACGDIDIAIAADGTWSYLGSPIGREPLVRLFASVLRGEPDGGFVLVTPVEKLRIAVADAPFLAVEMSADGVGADRVLTFRTNVGDLVPAGPLHPMRFAVEAESGALRPYVLVRGRLEALLSRALVYDLAELIEERGGAPGIASGGAFFPLPAAALEEGEPSMRSRAE